MAVAKVNNRGSIAAAQKANRLANKGLLDQATNDLDYSSNDSGDDEELDAWELVVVISECSSGAICRLFQGIFRG